MSSLFLRKEQKYPSLEDLQTKDNKMRVNSTPSLDVQVIDLCQGCHFLPLSLPVVPPLKDHVSDQLRGNR